MYNNDIIYAMGIPKSSDFGFKRPLSRGDGRGVSTAIASMPFLLHKRSNLPVKFPCDFLVTKKVTKEVFPPGVRPDGPLFAA